MTDERPAAIDRVEGPCFYFGCNGQTGHHLWTENRMICRYEAEKLFPFRYEILDAGLLPQDGQQDEGDAKVVRFQGWTVITFWDRSVDKRPGSNSAFILPGGWIFEDAIAISQIKFPWVWSRLTFEVRLTLNRSA